MSRYKTSPAVALSFQELEAVDLAFGLTAAPGPGQGGAHSCTICFQPGSESRDGGSAACAGIGQPGTQLGNRVGRSAAVPPAGDAASPHQRREPTGELHDSCSLLVLLDMGGHSRVGDAEGRDGLDQQP